MLRLRPATLLQAATFDDVLVEQAASEISDEMRASYNAAALFEGPKKGDPTYTHCMSPHVTVAR